MPNGFYKEGFGVELPHPPISLSVFLVVEEALRVAWDLMRTQPRDGFDLLNANEDAVTQELYEVLFDVVFGSDMVEGFDREVLTTITRESKVRNYDGAHLDKMPDLLVGLVDRLNVFKPSQDWLFIECKPVDNTHSVGVHYCDKGIIRFVRGEYAWTMTSAMMIGYAKDGYTISAKLDDALNARAATIPTSEFPKPCVRSKAGRFADVVCVSQHDRTFRYIETSKNAPSITVRHLWLRRN
jgi:hypothetical protein